MFPSPGDLPNPGIKPGSPTLKVDSLPAHYMGNIQIGFFDRTLPNTLEEDNMLFQAWFRQGENFMNDVSER